MAKIKRNKSPKSLLSKNKKNKTQSSGKILNGGIALMAIFLVGFIFSFSTKIIQNGDIDKVQFPAMSISESAEETVEREVMEEVGIKVKNIEYVGSQPWPFPSQLMLGYKCEYESGEIVIDENEIVEANWYKVDNLPYVPPTTSLSGKLINLFVEDHS